MVIIPSNIQSNLIYKPGMKYKCFTNLIIMATHWKPDLFLFLFLFSHFWRLKPSQITSFSNFKFHFKTFANKWNTDKNGDESKTDQASFTFWATCYNPIVKSGDFSPNQKRNRDLTTRKKKQINPGPIL